MRKLVIGLVLAVMAVFSLSAEVEALKGRHVDNPYEGHATVVLQSYTDGDSVFYFVEWWEEDGSDVVSLYFIGQSLERAFNVWNMSRDEIQSIRQFISERAKITDCDNKLHLLKRYIIK